MGEGIKDSVDGSTVPSSPQQARRFLSWIRREEQRKEEDIPEETKEELQGLREVTKDTLNKASHVLPELLQNADDIGGNCSRVTIELSEDALVFRNHKEPMAYKNVEALGAFTKSTKQGDLDSIGYFGIGFKTVFSLTDTPYIHSGYFSFQYKDGEPTTPVDVGYDEQLATNSEWFNGTTIVLPFTDETKEDGLEEVETQLENIGSLLPFLENITTIEVHEYNQEKVYKRETTDQGAIRIVHEADDENTVVERLRLFSDSVDLETDLLEHLAEKRRLDVEALKERNPDLQITIAVQIDDTGVPTTRAEQSLGTLVREESHLFSYFPTDADTHLPFDIQADFSLTPNREKIVWPDEFNKELLNHVPSLFADAFIQFHQERVAPSRILELIPDPNLERPSYLEPVVEEIISFVREEACVPDQENNLFQPDEVVFLQQPFRDLISEEEVGVVLNRNVRYPSEDISKTARARLRAIVDDSVVSVEDLLEEATDPTLYRSRDNVWFIRFFDGINQYWRSEYQHTGLGRPDYEMRQARNAFKNSLNRIPFLPLDNGEITSYTAVDDDVYRLPQGYADDYELFTDPDQLTQLSEDFLSSLDEPDDELQDAAESAKSFLFDDEPFSVPKLEPEDVVQDVINPAFESDSIEPEQVDRYILFIAKRARTLAEEADIKLQVRDTADSTTEFRSPESLYLGTEYIESFDSDTVFGKFENLKPVSDHYLGLGEQSQTEWIKTFNALGVKRRVEVREQDLWESDRFISQEKAEKFLRQHGDNGGTELHDEQILSGYNGQTRKWQWMKRNQRHGQIKEYKYAFVDRYLPTESREVLEERTADGAESGDTDFCREFLRMVNADWDSYYRDKVYRAYYYSEYTNKYRVKSGECSCPSSFGSFLRNSTWCPGSDDDIHRPNQLFIRNDQTRDKPVTFVDPEPNSQEVIEFLDFQKYPGIQVSIINLQENVEKYKRSIEDTDIHKNEIERTIRSDLWAISRKLNDETETIETNELEALERLEQTPFIYVANATPPFRTPSQVTWEGESLGDYSVPIADVYTDFESLLVDKLDVSRNPTLQDYISFLNTVDTTINSEDETGSTYWSDILTAWSRVLDEAAYVSEDQINTSDDQLNQARELLKTEGQIPTAADTLTDWNQVEYHTTDETLLTNIPKQIQDQILHPERDERYTSEKYSQRLERLTGTKPVESSLERKVLTDFSTEDRIGLLSSQYPRLFDAAYSYLENKDTNSDIEILYELADAPVYEVADLSCSYTVEGEDEVITDRVNCLINTDSQDRQILLSSRDQAGFELIEAIVQELQLSNTAREELKILMKGSFGKPEEMLQVYLEDDGYEHQEFTHPNMQEHSPDRNGESTDSTNKNSGTIQSGEDTESGDDDNSTPLDENNSQMDSENELEPSSDSDNGASDTERSGVLNEDSTGQLDSESKTKPSGTNKKSSSPSTTPSQRDNLQKSNDDSNTSLTDDTNQPANGKSSPKQTDQASTDSADDSQDTNEPASISKALDWSQKNITPTQHIGDGLTGKGNSGGGGGGGGGTTSGGETAVEVGKWGEDYMMGRLVEFLRKELSSDSLSEEWDWSGVHPETSDTVEKAQSNASGFKCPLIDTLVPGVQFTKNELQHPVTLFHTGESGVGADIYVRGAAIRQDTESDALELREIGPDTETWIEVKSTEASPQARTEVNFHPNEYQRAHLEEESYLIIRVCNALSEDVVISRVFSSLAELERTGSVSVDGELTLTF